MALEGSANIVCFGPFRLDLKAGELCQDGERVRLQEQPFKILKMLLEQPGEVVTREEIRKSLWPNDTIVEFDHSINSAVKKLRLALGDTAEDARYVETVARRGYRLLVAVDGGQETNSGVGGAVAATGESAGSNRERAQDAGATAGRLPVPRRATLWLGGSLALIVAGAGIAWVLTHRRAPQPLTELTQTRLTFNSGENSVETDALSPDGKYLAYTNPDGIHVRLLSTGEERLIPKPPGDASAAVWSFDSWFPDGTQMLFDMVGPGTQYSMWSVSVLGQAPRELRGGAGGWGVSPDGTRIAFSPGFPNHFREVWVMGSQGETPQKVLTAGEKDVLEDVHWSPDGKRLAYTTKPSAAMDWFNTAIETSDLTGADRTTIVSFVSSWMDDFCWLSDGRIVYSRADRPSVFNVNLWQVAVDDRSGRPASEPKRFTQWAGSLIGGLSASADGKRLVFLRRAYQSQVYLAELPTEGKKMSAPRQLTNDEQSHRATAWTGNSQAVLFSSGGGIFKQGITQETAEPVVSDPQGPWVPHLSADGAWVLYMMGDPNRVSRLMRVPAGGGAPQMVMETRPWWDFNCASAPSSLCVILEVTPDEKHLTVTAFDPVKGRGKVLRTIDKDPSANIYVAAVSPDGSTLALSRDRETEMHIRLLSLSGGPDREIAVKGWQPIFWNGLYWAPDGKGLYCGVPSRNQGGTILYVDLNGNSRVVWQFKGIGGPVWGVPSPNGRYLAMENHPINSNVWMLEGF